MVDHESSGVSGNANEPKPQGSANSIKSNSIPNSFALLSHIHQYSILVNSFHIQHHR